MCKLLDQQMFLQTVGKDVAFAHQLIFVWKKETCQLLVKMRQSHGWEKTSQLLHRLAGSCLQLGCVQLCKELKNSRRNQQIDIHNILALVEESEKSMLQSIKNYC